ncbi:MAG: hypothetical protein ACYDIA_01880 [Candidatus Humimicrobiaceae bacterium]
MNNFKCTKCGGNLIQEGNSDIYFCDNCCAMIYKDENGNFILNEGKRIIGGING